MAKALKLTRQKLVAHIQHIAAHLPYGTPRVSLHGLQRPAEWNPVEKQQQLPQAKPYPQQLPRISQQNADTEVDPEAKQDRVVSGTQAADRHSSRQEM